VESADWAAHFESLLGRWPSLAREACEVASNEDLFVSAGFLGFTQVQPAGRWSPSHRGVIRALRESAYSNEALAWHEEGCQAVAVFGCLFYGLMLGLDDLSPLSERDRMMGEALLPGMILSKLEVVEVGWASGGEQPG
jgi:hypothetical protein